MSSVTSGMRKGEGVIAIICVHVPSSAATSPFIWSIKTVHFTSLPVYLLCTASTGWYASGLQGQVEPTQSTL
jgi:hypothetical protein